MKLIAEIYRFFVGLAAVVLVIGMIVSVVYVVQSAPIADIPTAIPLLLPVFVCFAGLVLLGPSAILLVIMDATVRAAPAPKVAPEFDRPNPFEKKE